MENFKIDTHGEKKPATISARFERFAAESSNVPAIAGAAPQKAHTESAERAYAHNWSYRLNSFSSFACFNSRQVLVAGRQDRENREFT